jgi:hypothetical protein
MGISVGESLRATLFLQRAINSVRFEVKNSWSMSGGYAIASWVSDQNCSEREYRRIIQAAAAWANLGGSCLLYGSGKAVSGTMARGIFAEKLGEDVVDVLLRPEALASDTLYGEVSSL